MKEETNMIIEKLTEIIEKQNIMLEKQDIMEKRQDRMEKRQDKMEARQDKMEEKQDAMQEELIRIGNTVTRIEYEHGQKLDLILDVLIGHGEKLEEHDKRFEKNEKILEMHGHRIYALEQRKAT
ncbi:MAG: hypothetical protein HFJ35_06225 [Clostridia bacterium]|nr:hypothetical protein [Clostridia bacterium]